MKEQFCTLPIPFLILQSSFSFDIFCRVRIAFTLGIDATKIVKCWQINMTHCVLVGGAYPNHYILLKGLDKESVANLLEEYQAGKHGTLADKIKVCVLVFQCVAPRMSPNQYTHWLTTD